MNNAIEVKGLTKKYKNFLLDNLSFCVPKGFVSGFIGQNGAGKTTTLKLILGMVLKDEGDIQVLGKPADDIAVKEDMGILLDTPYFQEDWTPKDIENAMNPFYHRWDSEVYHNYLKRFCLNSNQTFKTMSQGMKIKLGMAVSLSHDAKILILDEPLKGLDPAARREMLGILREYMVKEDRSILFSTHITSDLEKIADYITYINEGKIWGFYLPLLAVGILYGFIQAALSWEGNETLLLNILEFSSRHVAAVSGGLTFLATLVLLVSFALSVHFYKKRDF